MPYFFKTVDTIPKGVGFAHFDLCHLLWLLALLLFTAAAVLLYRRADEKAKQRIRWLFVILLWADELWKWVGLFIAEEPSFGYLPFHLCSINLFMITLFVIRPSKLLGNYLYAVSFPAAMAALLFPNWTPLPPANFMHVHSFSVHILLAAIPMVFTFAREIRPDARMIPRILALVIAMAIPVYGLNLLWDTNFMFLMDVDKGNPLYLFEQAFGHHWWGFPLLIAPIFAVMYAVPFLWKKGKAQLTKKKEA